MRALNDNQRNAIEKLRSLKVGALFMGCGTGKTQTASELINSVPGVDYLLWVCPCQTRENLLSEIAKCNLVYKPDVIGVESIGMSDRIFAEVTKKVEQAKHPFIVCDESIKIKNLMAKRTRRMLTLARLAEYKLALNGTPITNGLLDVYAQMEFLSPKILNMGYGEFIDTFCCYRAVKRGKQIVRRFITGYTNVDYLLSVIKPYVYQCDLNLGLEKNYERSYYYLDEKSANEYYSLKDYLLSLYEFQANKFLGTIQRMQQSYCCAPEKFDILEKLIDEKTIVFCKFIRSRDEVKKRFPNVLCLTYGKGSFGLNLQKFNRIIYFDKTFDYAFREQSEARIYRTGQQDTCEYYDLTGNVGLENMMDTCIDKKTNLISYLKQNGKEAIEKL